MKSGIVRRIDDLGRIAIPKEIRKSLHIQEGDPIEISVDGGGIHLNKYTPTDEYAPLIKRLINDINSDTFFDTEEQECIVDALESAIIRIDQCVKKG